MEPEGVVVRGILLKATTTTLAVGHLGRQFTISQADVIDISGAELVPNTFGKGVAVTLTLKAGTRMIYD
jgi:hypothetical protein